MLKLTVSQDGSGDFASISEAVLAVPYELEAEISIGPGIYREKLVCEKRALTLRGAGADATTLIFGDGGKLPHPDGRPVPMPSHRIIWAAAGLQNCWTASPETVPFAAVPAVPNTARRAGFSQKSRVVIPLQESTCGGSKSRRQMRPVSCASAASSGEEKRVRDRVTAARARPRSSSVTAHSSGGVPRLAKNAATRPDL